LKAAKETKKDFVTACRALPVGTLTPIGGAAAASSTPTMRTTTAVPSAAPVGSVKTAGACEDEYKANKGALKSAKEKKKDFVAACRALPPGTPTPIGTAIVAPAPTAAPAPAPQQTAAPRQAPTPVPQAAPAAPAPRAQPAPSPTGANQFPAEASAKARCPGATVVWVNTQSKIYHFAGTKNYGNTKAGAYMCETDATAAGDRASKTEKHP
jgi:hypothetical protein